MRADVHHILAGVLMGKSCQQAPLVSNKTALFPLRNKHSQVAPAIFSTGLDYLEGGQGKPSGKMFMHESTEVKVQDKEKM